MEYLSRVPRPPLHELIIDLYYLEGAPPYPRLTLPPAPAAVLIVNLGAPFRIRAGTDIEAAEYADGVVVTTPTRALEFGYPPGTRSVGVHFKPWGLAPFLPMPAADLCDRPVTVEEVWGHPTVAELRDRLATAAGPHEMLTLLEDQLMRLVWETAGMREPLSELGRLSLCMESTSQRVGSGCPAAHALLRPWESHGLASWPGSGGWIRVPHPWDTHMLCPGCSRNWLSVGHPR